MKKLLINFFALALVVNLYGCEKASKEIESIKNKLGFSIEKDSKNIIKEDKETTTLLNKFLIGKLVTANQGDESCQLEILDKNNKNYSERSTFNLCHTDFPEGKVYKFQFGIVEMPDCDCQGDSDCYSKCTKTSKVEYIVDAKLVE